MSEKEDIKDVKDVKDIKDVKNIEELKPLADDWFGRHHIITRLITFVVVAIFIYVFMVPLSIEYAEIISYILLFVFITITFGINSLKLIIELVKAWRGK